MLEVQADHMVVSRIHQPDCTLGVMNYKGFRCFTLELPWKNNQQDISCIPAGWYNCRKIVSGKHGKCIEICDVVGRTLVRIHPANYTRDLLGCIAVGASLVDLDRDGIMDTGTSKATMTKMMSALPASFILEIK